MDTRFGLNRRGAPGVAVTERQAGRGTRGEHEVRSVHTSTRGPVDDDGLGLDSGLGVDEHHTALVWLQAGVTPGGQGDDDRAQRTAEVGQNILVPSGFRLIVAPFEAVRCATSRLSRLVSRLDEMPRFSWNWSKRV